MRVILTIIAIVFLVGAPLLGIHLSGEPVDSFLVFPPVNTSLTIDHAPFSKTVFFLTLFLILVITVPFIIKVFTSKKVNPEKSSDNKFPSWGWAGLLIMSAGWVLAWTRFEWFSSLQTHTFTIPWIGYIISVNAITFKRTGRSPLTHEPVYFAILFILSAIFWWYFEYLNQFTQNWYYVNVETLGRSEFFLYATLPFATVLPAVISTYHLLKSFPGLSRGLGHFLSMPISSPRTTAITAAIIATALLSLIGVWPDYLFPLLWLAPLAIISAAMVISDVPTFLGSITRGNWKTVYLLALSALVCGFFWEMWNYFSYTRWEYAVPYVGRFKLFEMPVLGYAGYLPFGLQCGLMALLVKHMIYPSSGKISL
ncbi:MAG: hypothetical protein R6U58_03900 [Bacteroidales bacterium]